MTVMSRWKHDILPEHENRVQELDKKGKQTIQSLDILLRKY